MKRAYDFGAQAIDDPSELEVSGAPLGRKFLTTPNERWTAGAYRERATRIRQAEKLKGLGEPLSEEHYALLKLSTARKIADRAIKSARQQLGKLEPDDDRRKRYELNEKSAQDRFNRKWKDVMTAYEIERPIGLPWN